MKYIIKINIKESINPDYLKDEIIDICSNEGWSINRIEIISPDIKQVICVGCGVIIIDPIYNALVSEKGYNKRICPDCSKKEVEGK